jgi:hypothetical protein
MQEKFTEILPRTFQTLKLQKTMGFALQKWVKKASDTK